MLFVTICSANFDNGIEESIKIVDPLTQEERVIVNKLADMFKRKVDIKGDEYKISLVKTLRKITQKLRLENDKPENFKKLIIVHEIINEVNQYKWLSLLELRIDDYYEHKFYYWDIDSIKVIINATFRNDSLYPLSWYHYDKEWKYDITNTNHHSHFFSYGWCVAYFPNTDWSFWVASCWNGGFSNPLWTDAYTITNPWEEYVIHNWDGMSISSFGTTTREQEEDKRNFNKFLENPVWPMYITNHFLRPIEKPCLMHMEECSELETSFWYSVEIQKN